MTAADLSTLWFSLWAAALATLVILPPGIAMAWLLARKNWLGKTLVETLVALPLVLPPVATGLILLKLLGRRGPFGPWLAERGIEIIFTWKAVVIALAVMSFPLLVRSLRTAFTEVPQRLEQVALTLGARPWHVFRHVTLPLARRGILAGILLSFARAMGEFGATMILAGYLPGETGTLALEINQAIQMGQDTRALQLVGLATLTAFVILLISESLQRQRPPA
ncbi:MAG: molybdate transporter permease [Verrucomicrobiales bacterium]|nr:molybdate transporter permease [Verrucomicrobiales bacterium]